LSASPRCVLITGCSSGIGYTCALGLKARGYRVIATARNDADLARLAAEGLETVQLDYADPASVAACAEKVLAMTGGRLYGLFNNGGHGQPGAVEDLPMAALRAQFEANFFGWHDLTRRFIPAMRAHREGRIVQCSSVLGIVALKWRGAYNAAKFALEALSDTLRLELEGSGIKVAIIEPGPIRSRFRINAIAQLHRHIDIEASVHRADYARHVAREATKRHGPGWGYERPDDRRDGGFRLLPRYRLGPQAVLAALIHALEHPRPKPRYRVTLATHLMALARRALPWRLLDRLVRKVS
jgi:NAD(P)-dependent dehydrogenase (short-subunit alcohol dehydrogenase family)